MKVEKLCVYRYKSFTKPFILDNPGKLHFFIGPNNSGKTNILDSIYQLFNENDSRLNDPQTKIEITFSVKSQFGNKLVAKQIGGKRDFELDNKKISTNKAEKILSHHIIRICATNPISTSKLQLDYKNFIKKYPREFTSFSSTLSKYIPGINFNSEFIESFQVHEESFSMPFQRLGEGYQQVFIILLYLFHPQFTILLLEEPEIHLHPGLVKQLLKILEKENQNNQIFLTTHSPLFIHTLNLHRLFRVTKEGGTTKVYSPRLSGKRLNYSRLTQELNADNCEMFFADKILLVEGPTDHILMRGLIDRFYQGPKNIKVIQVFGKSNVDIYTDLLEMFNIPFIVMLDYDALSDTGIKLVQHLSSQALKNPDENLINILKNYNIYILPNGSIENNYPLHYQHGHKHKPLHALIAASKITSEEYNSPIMKNLKEIIDSL